MFFKIFILFIFNDWLHKGSILKDRESSFSKITEVETQNIIID